MELAKKCTGKGQKCCSVSDNEDTSKKIFENKNVKHSHKVTQNYIKQTKQEVTNIYLFLPVLGLKKFLYKSATHRKRWSLRHHISLWWWLKKIEKKKHKYSTSFIICTWTPDASVHITQPAGHMHSFPRTDNCTSLACWKTGQLSSLESSNLHLDALSQSASWFI